METNYMADAAIVPSEVDQAPASELAPLSAREADDKLMSLFDGPSDTDPDETETGTEAEPMDDPIEEVDDDPEIDPEAPVDADPEDPETDPDAPDDYANGRFAADTAKVKMPDGRTISVAELKEFADNRAKDFQRDYTAKNTELSTRVKEQETREAEFSQQTERHSKEREFFKWFTQAYVPPQPQRPNVSAQVDPVAWSVYSEQMTSYNEMVGAWQQAQQAGEEATKAETEKTQQQRQAALAQENARLLEKLPALKDQAKREAFWSNLATDAEKFFGIPKDRIPALDNADMVYILHKAVKQMRLEANSSQVKKDVTAKPTLVRGSARQGPGQQAQRALSDRVSKLRQTGSTADADAVLLSFIK